MPRRKKQKIDPKQAQQLLWRQGILRWKLDSNQQTFYDAFYKCDGLEFVLCCSRQLGKSYFLCTLAIEEALRTKHAEIKFAAPTQKQVKKIIVPILRQLLEDCPEDIKPRFHAQEQQYEFPSTGSTIVIAGMDGDRVDNLRGARAHLCIIDEAAFSNATYVREMIEGVLTPMTLTTGGKIIIASTPARTPRHEFEKRYFKAKEEGNAIHRTIYDNPRLTPKTIERYMKAAGGENTTFWKREYLAQFVVDESLVAIPEFTEKAQKTIVTSQYEKPEFFDYYTAMDVGLRDATGVVCGFWDFRKAQVVIEDEILLHGVQEVRTDIIANRVNIMESERYGKKKPYFRISDTELLLINDLDQLHNLKFHPVKKGDTKEAGVNELRLLIQTGQLRIHPRCKHLVAQLESCIRDAKREKFDRIEGLFHFDLVDALIYLIRSIRRNKNPYPADRYNIDKQFFWNQPSVSSPTGQTFANIFKKPKKFE